MSKYGLLYQGSKNKIAEKIIDLLPPADNFYDLFAGGCAITHRALLSGKYKHIYANDICDMPSLFKDAIEGKYANEDRFECVKNIEVVRKASSIKSHKITEKIFIPKKWK